MNRRPDRREILAGAGAAALVAAGTRARANPAVGTPLAFLAIGDWGVEGAEAQRPVARAMGLAAAEANAEFVLSAGDNFYPCGVRSADDPQWKTSFEDVYDAPSLQVPWHAALGNHDYRGDPGAQLAYARRSRRWRMPGRYYALRTTAGQAAVDIFVLDTTPICIEPEEAVARLLRGRTTLPDPEPQLRWIAAQLAASRAPWKLVVGHHPIRSGGKHGGSPVLAARLEPLLERHGVQLYVCGHDHVLQHIQVGRTHHVCSGSGASAGAVAPVAGTRFAASAPGFLQVRFDPAGEALSLAFKGADAATLYTARVTRDG
jgi:tartrate-resistant acid phosphatase type 5